MLASVGGGGLPDTSATEFGANIVSDILIETCVHLVAEKLTAPDWLLSGRTRRADMLLADWPPLVDCDHTLVMDLDQLYRDFFVNDRELLFHSAPGTVPSFHDEEGNMYCAVPVFQHPDPDLARDLLSTNHRLPETADLAKFGTMVVAGSSMDHVKVLIPDTVGPAVDADSPVVLQHVVDLSLGPAVDRSSSLPPTDLALALFDNSVLPTLTRRRRAYWAEINPILRQWRQMPSMRPVDRSKYVAPPPTLTHVLPVFLALPCSVLSDVVCLGIEGSLGADS